MPEYAYEYEYEYERRRCPHVSYSYSYSYSYAKARDVAAQQSVERAREALNRSAFDALSTASQHPRSPPLGKGGQGGIERRVCIDD